MNKSMVVVETVTFDLKTGDTQPHGYAAININQIASIEPDFREVEEGMLDICIINMTGEWGNESGPRSFWVSGEVGMRLAMMLMSGPTLSSSAMKRWVNQRGNLVVNHTMPEPGEYWYLTEEMDLPVSDVENVPPWKMIGVWLLWILKRVERQRKTQDDNVCQQSSGSNHVFRYKYSGKHPSANGKAS